MTKYLCLLLMLVVPAAFGGEEAPFVDMLNCPICKNVSNEKGLMENMTWEHHLTATGIMTVSTVKPEYQPQFDRAKAGMKDLVGKVLAGEKMDICDYCTSITSLLKEGAKADNITTHGADVMVISSTDKEMIQKIRVHGQQAIDFVEGIQEGHER